MSTGDWRATGLGAWEIANAVGLRLTAADVVEWAPFHPLEIHWARRHGLSPREARRWAGEGVAIRDTIHARAVGLTIDELHRWRDAGFDAADAWEAKETGLAIPEAAAWREAGFVLPDALQLVRDGWSLAAASVARDAGVRRYADHASRS